MGPSRALRSAEPPADPPVPGVFPPAKNRRGRERADARRAFSASVSPLTAPTGGPKPTLVQPWGGFSLGMLRGFATPLRHAPRRAARGLFSSFLITLEIDFSHWLAIKARRQLEGSLPAPYLGNEAGMGTAECPEIRFDLHQAWWTATRKGHPPSEMAPGGRGRALPLFWVLETKLQRARVCGGVGQHPGCHPAPGFWRAPVAKPGGAGTRPCCALLPSQPLAPEISPSPSRRYFRVCFGWFHAFLLAADKISGESQTGAVDAGR